VLVYDDVVVVTVILLHLLDDGIRLRPDLIVVVVVVMTGDR